MWARVFPVTDSHPSRGSCIGREKLLSELAAWQQKASKDDNRHKTQNSRKQVLSQNGLTVCMVVNPRALRFCRLCSSYLPTPPWQGSVSSSGVHKDRTVWKGKQRNGKENTGNQATDKIGFIYCFSIFKGLGSFRCDIWMTLSEGTCFGHTRPATVVVARTLSDNVRVLDSSSNVEVLSQERRRQNKTKQNITHRNQEMASQKKNMFRPVWSLVARLRITLPDYWPPDHVIRINPSQVFPISRIILCETEHSPTNHSLYSFWYGHWNGSFQTANDECCFCVYGLTKGNYSRQL